MRTFLKKKFRCNYEDFARKGFETWKRLPFSRPFPANFFEEYFLENFLFYEKSERRKKFCSLFRVSFFLYVLYRTDLKMFMQEQLKNMGMGKTHIEIQFPVKIEFQTYWFIHFVWIQFVSTF